MTFISRFVLRSEEVWGFGLSPLSAALFGLQPAADLCLGLSYDDFGRRVGVETEGHG